MRKYLKVDISRPLVQLRLALSFINRFDEKHVNNQDKLGRTALHYAAIAGNEELINLLEKRKANGTIRDRFGKTAREYRNMLHAYEINFTHYHSTPHEPHIPPSSKLLAGVSVCIKHRFELPFSDSVQYKSQMRRIFQDARLSVDVTSYVQNIYHGCRFNYSDYFLD